MIIGDKLRKLRIAKGLSAGDIAKEVNITQSYMSRFENNKTLPSIEILQDICEFYGITLSEFFSEEIDPEICLFISKVKKLSLRQKRILDEILDELISKNTF